ncbi:MAG: DNA starvation/stationary phase protection protein [Proteobacteria bacterium]|nr:DNA starvation/stationary phase protection protein [Pseudomonadota bacterium]
MARTIAKRDPGTVIQSEPVETGIPSKQRSRIAAALSAILGETYKLMVKSHVYHWNVVGPLFVSVHKLTQVQYEDLFRATDEIAERVRALGFPAPHVSERRMELGSIALPGKDACARTIIEDLIADHEALARNARAAAKQAEESDDFASHDLLVGRLDFHEKAIWMLRAIVTE